MNQLRVDIANGRAEYFVNGVVVSIRTYIHASGQNDRINYMRAVIRHPNYKRPWNKLRISKQLSDRC